MHLGVDLLFLVPGETGGREAYARELLAAVRTARPDLRITSFVNTETARAGAGWWSERADRTVVLRRVAARREATWALGELAGIARAAGRAEVDVLHSPANFGPWTGPFARVLTLHDLGYRHAPELLSAPVRLATAGLIEPAARRAHRVLTGAAAVRDEIVRDLGVPADRVDVVPHGLGLRVGAGDAGRARTSLRAGDRPVVLAVATNVPHKNLPVLLTGHARLPVGDRPLLVLAGHGTDAPALASEVASLGIVPDVRLLGGVPAGALEDLYAVATLLVTTTRHEGFGLPVLEAMARGVPVAASDIGVLREVAGDDGAVWLDPQDPDSIAAAVARLRADGALRERLAGAGRARAAGYSWERAAAGTLAAYDRAVAARHGAPTGS